MLIFKERPFEKNITPKIDEGDLILAFIHKATVP
jgi:hypothetical protein